MAFLGKTIPSGILQGFGGLRMEDNLRYQLNANYYHESDMFFHLIRAFASSELVS